ncbi:Hint domain-containing protein [Acetobacter sp. P5B1]|uniref:Hint domain-containing protein n=1 Tax=Acetobacter sp. P5B1 TaxID=2762620 RepID=UPI001C053157|nr:Hint domain-containing protein [Acetobacter sp. P5B1]
MGGSFSTGGTNSSIQTYLTASNLSGATYTLTNASGGQLLFTPPGGGYINNIYGNLVNNGIISDIPSSPGTGSTFNIGSLGGNNTFKNTGTLTFKQLDATSGSTVNLYYKTIENASSATIDLESAGASTISAAYVANLTNDGTIKVVDTSGTGMTSNWGNGTGTFNNNGTFSIDDSAATSGSTTNLNFLGINNSGALTLAIPAASTAITTVGSGGFTNSGTWSINSASGGNIQIIGGTSAYTNTGTINVNDANLNIANALTGTNGTVNLSNGADVTLGGNSSGAGQTFNFSGSDNTLNVTNGTTFTGVIRGFSQGDQLDLNIAGNPSYDSTTGILTITTSGGKVYTYDIGAGYTGSFANTVGGVVTYSGSTPCFLAGSMIRTSQGEVSVENLQVGDEVVTFDWKKDQYVSRSVAWVGKASATVRSHLPDDEAGWPVRILKDAIAEGVPYKDMLVTSEHCLFFEGNFVPARMLVNGVSVFYDKSFTSYEYYHVETEQHSVIIADGMLTESYLDTGNRSSFRVEGKVVRLFGRNASWEDDAAAPLCVDRDFVEPLFRKIELRGNRVHAGHIPTETVELTPYPDVHLVTATGGRIRPIRTNGQHYSFMLPFGTESVRIVSRTYRPSDVIGPFVDDRRSLGVAVADIRLLLGKRQHDISVHLQAEKPEGWYETESTECAWTNGNAVLPLGDHLLQEKIGILSLTITAAGPYLQNSDDREVNQRKTG